MIFATYLLILLGLAVLFGAAMSERFADDEMAARQWPR